MQQKRKESRGRRNKPPWVQNWLQVGQKESGREQRVTVRSQVDATQGRDEGNDEAMERHRKETGRRSWVREHRKVGIEGRRKPEEMEGEWTVSARGKMDRKGRTYAKKKGLS